MVETTQIAVGATTMIMTIPGTSGQPLKFTATVVFRHERDGWRFAIDTLATM
jgi:ketosteroid isomerase-like protein